MCKHHAQSRCTKVEQSPRHATLLFQYKRHLITAAVVYVQRVIMCDWRRNLKKRPQHWAQPIVWVISSIVKKQWYRHWEMKVLNWQVSCWQCYVTAWVMNWQGHTRQYAITSLLFQQHTSVQQYFICYHLLSQLNTCWVRPTFTSVDNYLGYSDCLEDKREDYQNCSVLYCVPQMYSIICTLIWAVLKVH